jgi:hypothetical protein
VRACLFIDENGGTPSEGFITPYVGYARLADWLSFYVGNFKVETDIRPFQLVYRDFDLYLIDIGGWPEHAKQSFMLSLGDIVKSRPSRLYLTWTGETWEAFERYNPHLRHNQNCHSCCDPDIFSKIERYFLDNKNL